MWRLGAETKGTPLRASSRKPTSVIESILIESNDEKIDFKFFNKKNYFQQFFAEVTSGNSPILKLQRIRLRVVSADSQCEFQMHSAPIAVKPAKSRWFIRKRRESSAWNSLSWKAIAKRSLLEPASWCKAALNGAGRAILIQFYNAGLGDA